MPASRRPILSSCFILLTFAAAVASAATPVVFEIDGSQQHAISPYIYGTNQPNWEGHSKYLTLTRWGGNRTTAYNWETNASNAGSDWQHQNDNYLDKSNVPGNPVQKLVSAAHEAGASAIITVPTIGYVSADKNGDGDVNKTPDYLHKRFLVSKARKGDPFTDPPNIRDQAVYQDEFVWWLEKSFPEARKDPSRTLFYCLDNEPDLWSSTHARIHPQKPTYGEIVQLNAEYAEAIKAVAPKALVFGPVNYGWNGFRTLQDAPDAQGRDFLDTYLDGMRVAEKRAGHRLLDVLDLHWYPEARGDNVRITEDQSRPSVAAARIQAPRSLWDATYTENSWITQWSTHGPIRLLPWLREKIVQHYPGTRLAITEYCYGGGDDISGGLAQADALGIFGREGVFAAALWQMGQSDHRFIYGAFAMFRNYDGQGANFGSKGLVAKTNDDAASSVYASLDDRDRVIIVAINKKAELLPVTISLKGCPAATPAAVYQLTKQNARPVRVDSVPTFTPSGLRYNLPADSVCTIVLGTPVGRMPVKMQHIAINDDGRLIAGVEPRRTSSEVLAEKSDSKQPLFPENRIGDAPVVQTIASLVSFSPSSEEEASAPATKPADTSRLKKPVWPPAGGVPTSKNPYINRFFKLWGDVHNPANGYFSAEGVPYHSVETLIVEAPDYGHVTTSEAFSYWLWLESCYGRFTGDWGPLKAAWQTTEEFAIPGSSDQPTVGFYNPQKPATYAAEYELPDRYPAQLDPSISVGSDPIAGELKAAHGSAKLYGMHWLVDVDNWYGYGRRGDGTGKPNFINTFQRGPEESVWKTVPHPAWEAFRWGGPNGFLDLFTKDNNYSRQWRYTNAPDADARAIQALYWANDWASGQGKHDVVPAANAARMGDCLRYAFFDKYFKKLGCRSPRDPAGNGYESAHYLLSWYYAWGGAIDTNAGWSWRIGCSHNHFGYQNPMTAWILSTQPAFKPASNNGARDWATSLNRQMEFYRWLQSAEGPIAGGATNSWNGRYDVPPAGTPTFYGMAYDWQPVYHDPPSNNWFGMQVWSIERVAEYYFVSGDAHAKAILDKWVTWAIANTKLPADGSYAVPCTLKWSGKPDTWNPDAPGRNADLHVTVADHNRDVGVAASLAKTLLYYSGGTKRWGTQDTASLRLAKELLDRMWMTCRDDKGLSASESREDYRRFFEQTVYVPPGWSGKMANGDVIQSGIKFLDIRSKYKNDPDYAKVHLAYEAGKAPEFRYHRFWAQCEAATANAVAAIVLGLEK